MRGKLPAGWVEVALDDVCTRVPQRGPNPKSESFQYIDLGAIDNKAKRITNASKVATTSAPSRAKQVVAPGDVLFSTVRVYLENIALVPADLRDAIASTAFTVLRPGQAIEPAYLYRLVSARGVIDAVNALQRGNSPPSVQDSDVRRQRIPLPPISEQKRIVSRIEELFSEIDEGERALNRVQKLVERYRRSVLKDAVGGALTRAWRELHGLVETSSESPIQSVMESRRSSWCEARKTGTSKQAVYPEPTRPMLGTEIDVPATWAVVSIEAATLAERPIAYGVLQPGPDFEEGVPLIRVCDIADGKVDRDNLKHVAPEVAASFPRTRLQGGEVLLTIVGTIGRTGLVTSELAGANVARAVAVLSPQPAVRAEWLELCLREERMRQVLTGNSREVARKTLNLEQLRECAIPIPPLREQDEAISAVMSMLSQADAVASDVLRQLRAAGGLRQATLKAAFSGKLVPQDSFDEPASALLARLAGQTADKPASPHRRGRKVPA